MLQGPNLYYFAKPSDVEYKGVLPLAGAIVTLDEHDPASLFLSWPGALSEDKPDRCLRASVASEAAMWVNAIKRSLRFERLRSGQRPVAGFGPVRAKAVALSSSAQRAADAADITPKVSVPVALPSRVSLSFILKGGDKGNKGPPALVCGSLMGVESWYLGLTAAIACRRKMDNNKVIAFHTACIAASSGSKDALTTVPARVGLALATEAAGKRDEAVHMLKDILAAQPLSAASHSALGRLLLAGGDGTAALLHLKQAAALQEKQEAATLVLLGDAYDKAGQPRLAAASYDVALMVEPHLVGAHSALGRVQLRAKDAEDAVTHFRVALKLMKAGPDAVAARLELATALQAAGAKHVDAAIAEFEAVLAATPGNYPSQVALAALLPETGAYAAAVPYLKAVLKVALDAKDVGASTMQLALANALVEAEWARHCAGSGGGEEEHEEDEEEEEGAGSAPTHDSLPASPALLKEAEELIAACQGTAAVDKLGLLGGRVADRLASLLDDNEAAAEKRTAAEAAYRSAMAAGGAAGADASLWLGLMLKSTGRYGDAVAAFEAAVAAGERLRGGKPAFEEATDLLQRCKRLAAGQPEYPVVVEKPRKGETMHFTDTGLGSPSDLDGLSPEQRKAAYFAKLKASKKEKEEEEKAAKNLKLARMTDEERAEFEAAEAAEEKHKARKDKVMNRQMAAYGGSGGGGAAALLARGRGRGRGRGGK